MKSLKNVLAALAFVFAFGAAYATSATTSLADPYVKSDGIILCDPTPLTQCAQAGTFNCTISGVSWFVNNSGQCGTQLKHTSPPN